MWFLTISGVNTDNLQIMCGSCMPNYLGAWPNYLGARPRGKRWNNNSPAVCGRVPNGVERHRS